MRIGFFVVRSVENVGGIEKYTFELGRHLVARGHSVVVYTMPHYGSMPGEVEGMRVETVPVIRSKSLEKMTAALMAALAVARAGDVDIVHAHAFGPGMFSGIPRLFGKKVVVQGHGIEWKRSRWGILGKAILKATELPSVYFPQALTVVSRVQRDYLKERYGLESTVISTGVNPPIIEELKEGAERFQLSPGEYVLFASRLVKEKNPDLLIEAFGEVDTSKKLVIAGEARHEEKYRARIEALAARDERVVLTGHVSGSLLHELFTNAFAFVLPSDLEGLPTVLLEGMSYGLCCLASDIAENQEALAGHGLTFRAGDLGDLTRKLQEMVDDPDMVSRVGRESKDFALEEYSWDSIADKFEAFYEQVLNS